MSIVTPGDVFPLFHVKQNVDKYQCEQLNRTKGYKALRINDYTVILVKPENNTEEYRQLYLQKLGKFRMLDIKPSINL